jgi:hypothetical protein
MILPHAFMFLRPVHALSRKYMTQKEQPETSETHHCCKSISYHISWDKMGQKIANFESLLSQKALKETVYLPSQ